GGQGPGGSGEKETPLRGDRRLPPLSTPSPPLLPDIRDALIAFMAATAQATGRGDQGCPVGRYRACQADWQPRLPWPQSELHPRAVYQLLRRERNKEVIVLAALPCSLIHDS